MGTLTFQHLIFILQGTGSTILLSLLAFAGGAALGLPAAIIRTSSSKFGRLLVSGFVAIAQGIPMPVMMFLSYFGVALTGYAVPALVAAVLAMTVYAGSYLTEIWRGAIESVPRAQWEAAECLALTRWQRLIHVILPQALRISIPPTVGFLVQIIKNSSYAVVIGFTDLTYSAKLINNTAFQPFLIFSVAAVIYFLLCYPLSKLGRSLERRLIRT